MRNVMWLLLLGAAFFGLVIACGGSGDNPAGVGSGKGRILAGADQEAYGDPPTVYIDSPEQQNPPYEINELRLTIEGGAASGDASVNIVKVEVKVNDGDWKDAYLLNEPYFSMGWRLNVSLEEGSNTVYARAYDEDERVSSLDSVDIEVDMSGLEEGDAIWHYVPEDEQEIKSGSIIKNGKIYCTSANKLYCLDLDNGDPIWVIDAPEGVFNVTYVNYLPCPAITNDEEHLFAYSGDGYNTYLYCFDITSNPPTVEWSKTFTASYLFGVFVEDDRVYVSFDESVCSYYIPDPDDQNHPPITYTMPYVFFSSVFAPSFYDGKLYLTSRDDSSEYHYIRCFDLDGTQEWEYYYDQDNWATTTLDAQTLISSEGGVFAGFPLGPRAGMLDTNDGSAEWLKWADTIAANVTYTAYYHNTTNDTGYVFATDANGHIYCYNAATGDLVWDYYEGTTPIYGAPIISNGRLFVYMGLGLCCFNVSTGALVWVKDPGYLSYVQAISENKMILEGAICLYLPSSNTAGKDWPTYCQNNRRTNSFIDDAGWPMEAGDIVWTIENLGSVESMHITYAVDSQGTKKILFVAGDPIYYTNTKLYCYEANPYTDTPTKCWEFYLGWKYNPSTPIIDGDNVYIAGMSNFYCIDLIDGSEVWENSYGFEAYAYRTPVYANGKLYFGNNTSGTAANCEIYCINASDGSQEWVYSNNFGSGYPYGNIIHDIAYSPNGYIYAITYRYSDGGSALVCLDADTGEEYWHNHVANAYGGAVTVSDGKVYVTRHLGIYCYDDDDEENLVWSNTTYGGGYTPVVIDGDYLYARVNGGGYIRRFAKSNGAVDTNFQQIRATGYNAYYAHSGISVSNGYLYVGLADWVSPYHAMIRCYNIAENVSGAQDLGLEWTADTLDGDANNNVIRAGITIVPSSGFAYTGSYNGKIYCIYAPECTGGADWHKYSHDDTHTGTVTGE